MASNPTPSAALSAWAERGLAELKLPSGIEVKVHITDPATLIRLGMIPSELINVAMRQGADAAKPTEEELVAYSRLGREVAAGSVRAVRDSEGAWQPIRLTVEQADELGLPIEDLELLELVAMRRISVARVQAGANGQPPQPEEADGTVDGLGAFRGEREGADAGAGGADVRPEPGQDVPRPIRPAAGRSRRRSGGHAAA